jgi:hypothetical protein
MRKIVYWRGANPSPAARREFNRRGLTIQVASRLPENLGAACGAVFDLGTGVVDAVVDEFVSRIHDCIDSGLLIQVLARSDAVTGEFQRRADTKATLPNVAIGTQHQAHVVAQRQAEHGCGPAASASLDIELVQNLPPLKSEDKVLLRRAFHDCSKIVLDEMTGGLSDARVCAAHMTMNNSNAGRWPQPDFVKIDILKKIEREHGKYREYAERYIPFGQRPNIHTMVKGHSRALLRGSFVKGSESLWALVQRDIAMPVINHLFDETLKGWHDQAYGQSPRSGSIAAAMEKAKIIDPGRIASKYLDDDIAGGKATPPGDLWSKLISLTREFREAPCHGDLHAENVRVQDGRAILIDMASVEVAPITTDIAALETWLAFTAPDGTDMAVWEDPEWRKQVDYLYQPETFVSAPEPPEPTHPLRWMINAVRQLRQRGLAAQSEAGGYQIAVAVQLLRRCQWADGKTHDIYRRMHGYRIAERLTNNLVNHDVAM